MSTAKQQKDPATMTAGRINREFDALDKQRSNANDALIAAGRGDETFEETCRKTDPASLVFRAIADRQSALRLEIGRRYGPGAPSRLPRGFWKRWLAGHSIAAELRDDVLRAHEHEAERKRIEQETRARFEADVVELQRLLAELRAGRLPPEFEQKKGRRR
jgi:hypothetical protein